MSICDRDLRSYYQNLTVAIWQGDATYSEVPPFHPHVAYPEYDLGITGNEPNPAYEGVRSCLHLLGLDKEHYGKPEWNPLREIIKPGDKVVIKPNFVLSRHSEGGNLFSIITHPSILRAIVDYVYKALEAEGQVIIADAPQMDCSFQELLSQTHLESIQELYRKRYRFDIEILDLRDFWLDSRPADNTAYQKCRIPLPGDPLGSVLVNVGKKSAFCGVKNWHRFYGADYNRQETIAHHHNDVHEYMISRTVLSSDVVISVPKLKVHKKVGVTLNAKGLVGINTNKNCLVHYTLGSPEEGGDQFPPQTLTPREKFVIKGQRFLSDALLAKQNRMLDRLHDLTLRACRILIKPWFGGVSTEKRLLDGGNWHGNDSTWRMVVDLMRIVLFADESGCLASSPQRKVFSIVDGIIGGENNGPLTPDAKEAGIVMAGFNPLCVDIIATSLMGFNWRKLRWIDSMCNDHFYVSPDGIRVVSRESEFIPVLGSDSRFLDFVPHPGWRGYVQT